MLLVSCANEIKFHNCEHYEVVQKYKPADNTSILRSISWCRDGSLISLVTTKGNAEIIRTKDDVKLIQSIAGQQSAISFQKSTKKSIALGTGTGLVHVYDIKTRSSKKVFTKTGESVCMLEWNCKDSHLAVLRKNGELSLYNNINNVKSCTVEIKNSKTISTFRFHGTNKGLLSCASDEGSVSVWDCTSGKNKFYMQTHAAPVTDLVFSSQNDTLLTSTSLDRSFNCYDIKQGEIGLSMRTCQPLSAIDMAPNGLTIAVGSIRGVLEVFDLRKLSEPLHSVQAHDSEIKRVLYQPQGGQLAETFDITEDAALPVTHRNSSVDSFASILNSGNEFSPKFNVSELNANLSKKRVESLSDSFIDVFSPHKNDSVDKLKDMSNLGITEGVNKWIDSKNIMDRSNPHCSGLLEAHQDVLMLKGGQTSSTPKLVGQVGPDFVDSPVTKCEPLLGLEELRQMVKDTVREAVRETVQETIKETVTSVVDDKMREVSDAMHKYYLSLLMCLCRHFVFQEKSPN